MPVFTDLERRLNDPPFDRTAYDRRLPVCREAARRMALVHVTGGKCALGKGDAALVWALLADELLEG